jgi:hypothetical protein
MIVRMYRSCRAIRPRIVGSVVGLAVILAACDAEPSPLSLDQPLHSAASQSELGRILAAARAGTARFHDVNVAVAEGYEPISECVSIPGLGGMGIHYGKFALFMDAAVAPGEPEILLYEPHADGSLRLVGVEYAVSSEAWHAAGNAAPPAFAGHSFEHAPGAYVLHAWVWKNNPAGVFTSYNPKVTCPDGGPGHEH